MEKISAVLLTRNEERNIERCLQSIDWVDEIVIVDTGSTDRTLLFAEGFSPIIVRGDISKGFAHNRNLGNDSATHDWILKMEPDEVVPEALRAEILERIEAPDRADGYYAPRKNYFGPKWIRGCGWYPMPQIRLFDKRKARWKGIVHEWLEIQGRTANLNTDVIHYSYEDIQQYFHKFNLYTSFDARRLKEDGLRITPWNMPSRFFLRPLLSFLKSFILQKGWKDGFYGYAVSLFSAFYVMVKYMKLYEIQKDEKTNRPERLLNP